MALLTHHARATTTSKDADLVIEAVFEDMGVKEQVFKTARRGDEARRDPGVATPRRSTSTRSPSFTKRPQDVIGMHFFSPANVMKLLEVVRGEKTAQGRARHRDGARPRRSRRPRRLRRLRRLHRQPHDRAVLAPGRLPAGGGRDAASRSTRRSRSSASRWGRSAWATSPATTSAGRSASAATSRSPTCATARPPTCCARWAASARRPAPAGTTTRPGKRDAIPSQVVDEMIEEHRTELGITPRKISDDEIVHRLVYALVNEGAQDPRRRHRRSAPATSTWSTSPATASRCTAAAR